MFQPEQHGDIFYLSGPIPTTADLWSTGVINNPIPYG